MLNFIPEGRKESCEDRLDSLAVELVVRTRRDPTVPLSFSLSLVPSVSHAFSNKYITLFQCQGISGGRNPEEILLNKGSKGNGLYD